MFLATYRCLPHRSLGWKSPAEILHGRQPRNLLSLLNPMEKTVDKCPRSTKATNRFNANDMVYARNYGPGLNWFPGRILGKIGSTLYRVQTDKGIWRRHTNQLQLRMDNLEEVTPASNSPSSDTVESRRYPQRTRRRPRIYGSATAHS